MTVGSDPAAYHQAPQGGEGPRRDGSPAEAVVIGVNKHVEPETEAPTLETPVF